MADDPRDPGWGPAIHAVTRLMIPLARGGVRAPLTVLRAMFPAFVAALAMLAVVILALGETDGEMAPGAAVAFLAAVAGLDTALVAVFRGRPLLPPEPETIAAAYRTSVLLRVAYAELTALVGFVLYFYTGTPSTYFLGVTLSLPGYLMAAPSAGDVSRHQERLNQAGVGLDLMGALTDPS
jgi:hypothetical protein